MKMFTITVLVFICMSFATTSFAWHSHYGNPLYYDSRMPPYHQLHNYQYDYLDDNNNNRRYQNGYNRNYGYDDNNYKYNNEYYSYDENNRYNQYGNERRPSSLYNKNKNYYDNSNPRNRNYEEDYVTYDKNTDNNNHQQKQQYDENKTISSDKPKEIINNDEQKTVAKKVGDAKPQSDYGSFVKGTYDDNYYKADKRQKRKSNEYEKSNNGYNNDHNGGYQGNGENSDCNSACLDNIRQYGSDEQQSYHGRSRRETDGQAKTIDGTK